MKKKIAVVLAALMMLSCTPVFAAGSVSTDVDVEIEHDEDMDVSGILQIDPAQDSSAMTELKANQEAGTTVANKVVAEGKKAEVVAMVIMQGNIPDGKEISLIFTVNGVQVGDKIVVSHLRSDNGKWETFDGNVIAAGKVKIDGVDNLSPFYIAKVVDDPDYVPAPENNLNDLSNILHHYSSTAAAAGNTTTTTTPVVDSTATLPKTGAPVVLPFAALACVAGAVVCGRKAK